MLVVAEEERREGRSLYECHESRGSMGAAVVISDNDK